MSRQKKKGLVPERRFPEFRDNGEWEEKTLRDLCEITNGKSNAQDHIEGGVYPLFDRSEVVKRSNEYLFDCETVILPGEGMRFIPKYYAGKFDLHQRAYALKDFSCKGKFVYYSMAARSGLLARKAVQSTVLSLRLPILQNFPIQIPRSPEEQQKIADCLTAIDELITAQTQKLGALKAHKKGLMQQLFPVEGETIPKRRFPEFRDKGEWEEKILSQVCEINPSANALPESFVYIDLESVEAGRLLKKNLISREGSPSRAQRLLKCGDVIFQMVRPYQKNNYYFLPDDDLDYVASTGYAQLRANESSRYLFQYLHNDRFVDRVLSKCTGSNYPAINSSSLSEILVEVPQPEEQQKIADCLTSIDELISNQAKKVDALKAHKKGLMQQLFPAMDDDCMDAGGRATQDAKAEVSA